MKKVLTALVLVSLLAILVVPLVASAQVPPEITKCKMRHDLTTDASWANRGFICAANGADCIFSDTTKTCGVCCLMDTVYTVTDWIFVGVVTIVIIFILWGAFNLLTAAGSPEKIKLGRDQIIYASIGMLVALLAKAIPYIVRSVLGV